ncbi:hypothetical protein JNB88_22310 [Rhizobium cauense]|uniref:hypothetical protein n=1 Tax=Rhizobium cauense TaxID=1166683 RepID=UPI001C6E9596|nr:hypothetical protein [Rhizobium cauense]MBW9116375.1 hypothetical protein [Rhizobium cauense]
MSESDWSRFSHSLNFLGAFATRAAHHYKPLALLKLAGPLGLDAAGTLSGVVFQDGGLDASGIKLTGAVSGFFGSMAGVAVGNAAVTAILSSATVATIPFQLPVMGTVVGGAIAVWFFSEAGGFLAQKAAEWMAANHPTRPSMPRDS